MTHLTHIPQLSLESGQELTDVPVAHASWGALNEAGDNAIVVCHALTGDPHADQWWSELIGPGRSLDTDRYFVICASVPGSPYGSISPLTTNPSTGRPWGPVFPSFTIRDTVRLHRLLLDRLGVTHVRLAIGGSMGGMQALEWAFEEDFVGAIAPIAAGAQHSPWSIAWGEAQRLAIAADANWQDGWYDPARPPERGLAAARAMAMVSYRSAGEFEGRFGRDRADGRFDVASYLGHHGQKLVDRFDANCYVHLTRQMDTHDIARGRGPLHRVLASIHQPALVIGFSTDVLYPAEEQRKLAAGLPNGTLHLLDSSFGHDSFLVDAQAVARILNPWFAQRARACAA